MSGLRTSDGRKEGRKGGGAAGGGSFFPDLVDLIGKGQLRGSFLK
jgi:hypothetical protein